MNQWNMSRPVRYAGFMVGLVGMMFPDALPVSSVLLLSLCLAWPEPRRRRVVVRHVLTDLTLEDYMVNHCLQTGKVCFGHVNKDGSYTIEEFGE